MAVHPVSRWLGWGLKILVLALAAASEALSEPKAPVPGLEVVRKAQGVIRQLSQERAALEAEKAAWLADKAKLDAKLKGLEATVDRLKGVEGELERYKNGLASVKNSLEARLSQQSQREQVLLQKYNQVVTQARAIRDDNSLLLRAVQEREQWITRCGDVNRRLREVNQEILEHYQQKGLWQQLAELEPLTGIGGVQTENIAEEYRYRLKQLQVTPFEAAVAEPASPAPVHTPGGADTATAGELGGQADAAPDRVDPRAEVER